MSKAEKLTEVKISKKNLIEVNLEDFINSPGKKIYYFEGYFYKESKKNKKWLRTKEEIVEKKQESLQGLIDWCGNFKKYVDEELAKIRSEHEETFKEFKEYIDNKTKK